MKKAFVILSAAFLAFSFTACTEKESLEPGGGGNTTTEEPQHNSLYKTKWAGTTQETFSLPVLGDITFTLDNTVEFKTDSTASSFLRVNAGNIISRDTNVACTYTWTEPNGVLTAVKNPQMSINFHKVNNNTINITIYKSELLEMWSTLSMVEGYLPESFSIDLIKQE